MHLPMFQPNASAIRTIMAQTWSMGKKCATVLSSNIADAVKDFAREMLTSCRAQADAVGEGATLDAILNTPAYRTSARAPRMKRVARKPPRRPTNEEEQEVEVEEDEIQVQGAEQQEEEEPIIISGVTQKTPSPRGKRQRRPPTLFTPDS